LAQWSFSGREGFSKKTWLDSLGGFEQLRNDGKVQRAGGPLIFDGKIVTNRKRSGEARLQESKEAIGGFLIIQADNLSLFLSPASEKPCR